MGADHQFHAGVSSVLARDGRVPTDDGGGGASDIATRAALRRRRLVTGRRSSSHRIGRAPGAHVPKPSTSVLRVRIGDDRATLAPAARLPREVKAPAAQTARKHVSWISGLAADVASCPRRHDSHFRYRRRTALGRLMRARRGAGSGRGAPVAAERQLAHPNSSARYCSLIQTSPQSFPGRSLRWFR